MIFRDRTEAGIELADKLKKYAQSEALILAIPRGGVPVGCVVARELQLPLRVFYVKKIGHPRNREFAIGAVGIGGSYLMPNAGVGDQYIRLETEQIQRRLRAMQHHLEADAPPLEVRGRTVIIVDDGVATGNTLQCAIRMLRAEGPASIVVATPVASRAAAIALTKEADEFVAVEVSDAFTAVGEYYLDFHPVEDQEVLDLLREARPGPLSRVGHFY